MTNQIATALIALKKFKFRSSFKLTDKDRQYIQAKGIDTIRSHAFDFATTRLAPAFPKNDGKQTPMRGHPVFIAQHATATCCRGCLRKWHRIEKGRPMTEDEIGFVVESVVGWLGPGWLTAQDIKTNPGSAGGQRRINNLGGVS